MLSDRVAAAAINSGKCTAAVLLARLLDLTHFTEMLASHSIAIRAEAQLTGNRRERTG